MKEGEAKEQDEEEKQEEEEEAALKEEAQAALDEGQLVHDIWQKLIISCQKRK